MKSLQNYITESAKEHVYHIKLACKPSEEQLTAIESYLKIYDLTNFSKPVELKDDKIDFFDIMQKQVHCIKFATMMTVSPYVLQQQLRDATQIPEKFIIVRSIDDPVDIAASEQLFKQKSDEEAKKQGFTMAGMLDTERTYDKDEEPTIADLFGNDYNKAFLANLAKIKANRKSTEIEPKSGLFSWLDKHKVTEQEPVQDTSDFNAHIDTPKPAIANNSHADVIDPKDLGLEGNFDDGVKNNVRFYNDKTGKREVKSAPRVSKKA